MKNTHTLLVHVMVAVLAALFLVVSAGNAAESVPMPKEFGVYAKTNKGLKRILPNMVSDEENVFYIEPNNPQHFPLGSIDYFVVYGNYKVQYLTLNPMKPFKTSPLGIPRLMFGKDIEITVTRKGNTLLTAKPKGLFGRGYYSLWIEDTAWDFVID
jgi:hypothetical protein